MRRTARDDGSSGISRVEGGPPSPDGGTGDASHTGAVNAVEQTIEGGADPIGDRMDTGQDIRRAQEDDGVLQKIRGWLSRGEQPKPAEMGEWKQVLNSRWAEVKVVDGVVGITSGDTFRAAVPKKLRHDVMAMAHDHVTSGHLGRQRTSFRVRRRFIWPGMYGEIRAFCEGCTLCQRRQRPAPAKRAPMVTELTSKPFERIAADITEMPTSLRGNKCALVIMDYFSKYVRIYPMANQKTETVLEGLLDWVHDFGVPERLHSDQGSQFESRLFQAMCERLGIKKTRTTPYHPESDGMVERFNRTLKDMVSKYIDKEGLHWDEEVKAYAMAYNSSVHSTTGYTPYFLVHGFEPRMPLDAAYGPPPEAVPVRSYLEDRLRVIRAAYERVRSNSARASQEACKRYNQKGRAHAYQVGDKVLVRDFTASAGGKPKLGLPYKGPWTVVGHIDERNSGVVYRVVGSDGKTRVLHHNHLKPFKEKRQRTGGERTGQDREATRVRQAAPTPRPAAEQGGGRFADDERSGIPQHLLLFQCRPPAAGAPGGVGEGRADEPPVYGPPTPRFTRAGRMSRPVVRYQAGSAF